LNDPIYTLSVTGKRVYTFPFKGRQQIYCM